jgi:hypothetical protein
MKGPCRDFWFAVPNLEQFDQQFKKYIRTPGGADQRNHGARQPEEQGVEIAPRQVGELGVGKKSGEQDETSEERQHREAAQQAPPVRRHGGTGTEQGAEGL